MISFHPKILSRFFQWFWLFFLMKIYSKSVIKKIEHCSVSSVRNRFSKNTFYIQDPSLTNFFRPPTGTRCLRAYINTVVCHWSTLWSATDQHYGLLLINTVVCHWSTLWSATDQHYGLPLINIMACHWSTLCDYIVSIKENYKLG